MAPLRSLLLLLLLAPAPALRAQGAPAPVHLIATGGTISNTGGDRLSGDALVGALPELERVAALTVEQFSNVSSGDLSLEQWRALARRINELFRSRPELAGVVVTHGTDTLEETAYFLELTVADCRPVVVTGAMRRATAPGADGPANLLGAIRLAASPRARGLGTVVVMNDQALPAREATKLHTSRVDAFAAPEVGPAALLDPDSLVLLPPSTRRSCGRRAFDVGGPAQLPRVDIVYGYQGADGELVRAAVRAGARGIVYAALGRGGSTPGQRAALREAAARGVVVATSSRTGAGRVPTGDPSDGAIGAGDLNPQKARVLLMLALTRTRDPAEIARIFAEH